MIRDTAEVQNAHCLTLLDEILLDLSDGKLDMADAALAAKVGLVSVRIRDLLRRAEASGIAKTRPMEMVSNGTHPRRVPDFQSNRE